MKKATMSPAVVSFQAAIVRAIGHPLRIQIIGHIGDKQRQVAEIIAFLRADAANVSRHLGILRRAGILATRKQGRNVFYRMALTCVPEFLEAVGQAVNRKVNH